MSSSQVNGGIPIDYVPPPPPPITGTLFSNNNHNHNTTTSHHHSEPEPDHATAGLPLPPSVATAVSTPSWSTISCENPSAAPCQRSLHAGAVHQDSLYVFGGYDGTTRVNDFIEFDFQKKRWRPVLAVGSVPTPRDRHTACVYNHSLYVFGGFDGTSRVNDFTGFDFNEGRWSHVPIAHGFAPSPRHSHAAGTSVVAISRFILNQKFKKFTSYSKVFNIELRLNGTQNITSCRYSGLSTFDVLFWWI